MKIQAGKLSLDKEIRVLYDEFKKKGGKFFIRFNGIKNFKR